jgi:four helix bundle protein
MAGFRSLRIYRRSYELAIKIHNASLKMPKFELYEQGSQIRRSSKSIKDNIAEGYGRRRYQGEYIRFLVYAQSSCDECVGQIDMISELYPELDEFEKLKVDVDELGKMINRFIQSIDRNQ